MSESAIRRSAVPRVLLFLGLMNRTTYRDQLGIFNGRRKRKSRSSQCLALPDRASGDFVTLEERSQNKQEPIWNPANSQPVSFTVF